MDAEELLADPAPFARAALPPVGLGPIHGRAEYIVARPGRLDGVAAWFDAELAAGVRMTNAPMAPERIRRRQVVLPTAGAVAVEAGDRVTLAMAMLPPDMVNWQVSVRRGDAALDGASFSHSTFRGMLLSAEDLSRTRLDSRPVLTPAGVARRTVLELCDGSRPLREVQDGVFERHRQLFATHHDAATFVAEVVTRYCVADAPLPDREPPRR